MSYNSSINGQIYKNTYTKFNTAKKVPLSLLGCHKSMVLNDLVSNR